MCKIRVKLKSLQLSKDFNTYVGAVFISFYKFKHSSGQNFRGG